MNKKFEKVGIDAQQFEQLKYISKVTSIPMAKILEQIIQCMFELSIEYDKATFRCFDMVTEDTVHIIIHGYNKKLVAGSFKTTNETESEIDTKIYSESKKLLEKAERENSETFGDEDLAREGI